MLVQMLNVIPIMIPKVLYANNSTLQGADYAEYFEKEDDARAGDLVGLNPATGKVRVYQTGDQLLVLYQLTLVLLVMAGLIRVLIYWLA